MVLISTDAIDGRFGSPEKKFSIDFTIAKTEMFFSLRYNHNNSFLFVNGEKFFTFKADNKNIDFQTQFCLGRTSNRFGDMNSTEVSLKRNV